MFRLDLLTTHCDGTREWYDTNHEYLSEESAFHTGMTIMENGYCTGFEIVKDTQVIFRQVKNSLPEYLEL